MTDKIKKILHSKPFRHVCLIAFFAVLFMIRFSWFDLHYTHYDDIKVAQFTDFTADLFKWKFEALRWNDPFLQKLYNLTLILLEKPYNWVTYALNFSKYWTYAPGQFVITFALLPLAYDYTSIKFFGRLPSLIFGCIALIFCWKAAVHSTGSKKAALCATAVLGLSWQSILYCMHMSNYESIILIGFIVAFYLSRNADWEKKRFWLLGCVLLGIFAWFHYQAVCYLAGFLMVYFVWGLGEKKKISRIIVNVVILGTVAAVLVAPLLGFANLYGVPTWNVGIDGEYLFTPILSPTYLLRFFVINSWKVFKAMLSPVPLDRDLSNVITIAYLLLFLYGTIRSLRQKEKNKLFYLTIFSMGVILAEYGMVVLGKFTLSPTRHSNVLIPVFVTQILFGVYFLMKDLDSPFLEKGFAGIFAVSLLVSWNSGVDAVKAERIDPYTQEAIFSLIGDNNPDLIVDRSAGQMWYLVPQGQYQHREIIDYQTDVFDINYDAADNQTILIVSGDSDLNDEMVQQIAFQLLEKQYLSPEQFEKFTQSASFKEGCEMHHVDFDFYSVSAINGNSLVYRLYSLGG